MLANPISDKFFSYSCYGNYDEITASAATATAAAVTSFNKSANLTVFSSRK